MKTKRLLAVVFTAAALIALLTLSAHADSWWENASADIAVYPLSPQPGVGDVDKNGVITAADARRALRFSVGLDAELLPHYGNADYDGSGEVTAADARLILRCAVGLEGSAVPPADNGAYRIRVGSSFYKYDLGELLAQAENAGLVTGYRTSHFPIWRLRSAADVQAFCDAFDALDMGNDDRMDVPVFLQRYDDAFFADRDLFICFKAESSGSNLQAVYAPAAAEDGALTFSVGSVSAQIVTCDIGCWFVFLPMEKSAVEGYASFDCIPGPGGTLPDKEIAAAANGKTRWMFASDNAVSGNAEISMTAGETTAFALECAQDGSCLWSWETDVQAAEYSVYSSGYFDDSDADCDLSVGETRLSKPNALPGDPGLQLYTVYARTAGTYTLRFSLKRAGETAPAETCTVTLLVSPVQPYSYISPEETAQYSSDPDAEIAAALQEKYRSTEPDGLIHTQSWRVLAQETTVLDPYTREETYYLLVYHAEYSVYEGLHEVTGELVPVAVTLSYSLYGGYSLKAIVTPRSGALFESDVRAAFPAEAADAVLNGADCAGALQADCLAQAEAYLNGLG